MTSSSHNSQMRRHLSSLAILISLHITGSSVTFVDLTTNQPESLQANLIMPQPDADAARREFDRDF